MEEMNWVLDLQNVDSSRPPVAVEEEVVYTLQMGDFLRMPDIDFSALSRLDPAIRALLN